MYTDVRIQQLQCDRELDQQLTAPSSVAVQKILPSQLPPDAAHFFLPPLYMASDVVGGNWNAPRRRQQGQTCVGVNSNFANRRKRRSFEIFTIV